MAGRDLSLTHCAPQDTLTLHPHNIITVTASPPLALFCFPCSLFLSCRSVWLDFPLSLALCLNSPLNPSPALLCSALSFLSPAPPRVLFAPWGGTSTRSLYPGTGSHCGNTAKQVRSRLLLFFPSFFLPSRRPSRGFHARISTNIHPLCLHATVVTSYSYSSTRSFNWTTVLVSAHKHAPGNGLLSQVCPTLLW